MPRPAMDPIVLKNIKPRYADRDLRNRPTRATSQRDISDLISDAFVRVITPWIGHRGVEFRLQVVMAIRGALETVVWPVTFPLSEMMIIIELKEEPDRVDVTIRPRTAIDALKEATGE